MFKEQRQTFMEDFFTALADRTRLRILNLMNGEEISVGYFAEILVEPQPKISRHLAYLRQSGIVETTREGKWIYYRIAEIKDEGVAQIFKDVLKYLAIDEQMKSDRERLKQFRIASNETPIAPERAARQNEFQETEIPAESFKSETENRELPVYLL